MFEYTDENGVVYEVDQAQIDERAKEKGITAKEYLSQTSSIKPKKTNDSQQTDAPVELKKSTASNSADTSSESQPKIEDFPVLTDNPETVKKAREAGFSAVPGARFEDDTIFGVTLPEAVANPLTFEEQLNEEQQNLETKSKDFSNNINNARKVIQDFKRQNIGAEGEKMIDPPTKETYDEYNKLIGSYNTALETGQAEIEGLSQNYNAKVEEFNSSGNAQKLTAKQSIKNSFSNVIQDGKNVFDYYLGDGPGLDLATDQVYRTIFGDERIDAFLQRNKDNNFSIDFTAKLQGRDKTNFFTEGLLTDEQRVQKIKDFQEKQQDRKPTLEIIESFAEGNLGEKAASVLSAVVNIGGSVVYNKGTLGTGYFMDFASQNYIDYNSEIAASKGKTLEQLILDGEDDGGQAVRLASLQAGAELFGYRKIKKALGGKIKVPSVLPKKIKNKFNYSPKAKTSLNILTASTGESVTEVFQGGIEEYNKKSATDPNVSFTDVIMEYAQSAEGMEAGIQGFVGPGGLTVGSYSAKAVSQARKSVDGLKVEGQINEIISINEQIEKTKDQVVKQGLEASRDQKTQELSENIKKGNKLYNSLSEGDITELENIHDIADVQAARAVELQLKFDKKQISEKEYKSALEGYRSTYKAAEARAKQITADKVAENVEKQVEELGSYSKDKQGLLVKGKEGKVTKMSEKEISNIKEEGFDSKSASKEFGFIKQFSDGTYEIIINADKPPRATEAHEFMHAVLFKTIGADTKTQDALGAALTSFVNNKTSGVSDAFVDKISPYVNQETGQRDANFGEEVITVMSESIIDGSLEFEESFFTKVGDIVRRFLQGNGLTEVRFDSGKDVYNFVRDYSKSISEGKTNKAILNVAKQGAKGKLVDSAESISQNVNQFSKNTEASSKVQEIYNEQGEAGMFDIFEQFKPITTRIARRFRDVPGYDEQLIIDEIETGNRGMIDLIRDYKPETGVPLAAYINKFLPARSIEAGNRILKTEFESDITEEKGVAAEEAVEQQPERKTKLKVLADQLNVSKQVDGAVANADVDVTSIFNFKSVPNAVAGTVGELMGISPDKIKSKANLTKSELANAQRFIKKNVGTLIGMMPEGFDSSGNATGVPKTMLDAFYTKRESRAKTKAGLQTQVKRGNIKDSEFLEIFNIFEGIPDRSDRNTSARVIALANLMGKVMTNQSIRKQNPSVVSIADGMSKIMFSKEIDLNKTKDIDKTIEWGTQGGFALQPKSYWMKGLHGSGAKNTNIEEDGEQVYLDENNNKTFKKTKTKLKRYPLKTGGSILNNDPNFSESTINHVPASKGIFANAPQRDAILNKYEEDGGKFLPASETYQAASDRTTVYGKKTGEQVKALINKNQDKFNKSEKGFIDYWLNIQEDIENNPKNEKYWAALLEVTSTNQSSFMRVGSRLIGYNTLGLENREEHMSPASDFAKYLFQMAKDGLLTRRQMKQAMKSYTQISLPLIYDEMLKGVDVDGKPFDYTKVLPKEFAGLPVKLQILQGMIPNWVRYINPNVNAMPYTLNGKQYYGMNPNVLMLGDGRNLAQTYGLGVDSSLEMNQDVISVQQELLFKVFMNNITKAEAVSELSNYVNSMIPAASTIAMFSKNIDANKANVNPNGITILDFDDTLATTKSNILYTAPDGTKGKLNAEEFAKKGADLLGQGYVYDFSEFNKVVRGKTAPLFNKALKLAGKFGTDNMFVLTARPAEAALAISQFLKANGLDIPLKNITGLGNSTAEAKALWVAGKFSEGYNDFYFADDAIQNVKAVDNILEQFDVKRKVQQAKIQFSKTLDPKFNEMLERSAGVGALKIFSRVEAAKRGKNKGGFTFFVPPSAEDFTGLLRYFAGTGKQGDADIQFFNEALIKPFARADRAMGQMKQAIRDDHSALRKKFPKVKKKLGKLIEGTTFTNDMAVRVYLFDKAGYEIPGISKQGKATLINTVKGDLEMRAFADALGIISKQKDGYLKPGENWNVENIALDLQNATNKVGRKQFLQEWVQNKEIIFSPENINKIEAVYGTQFKEALKDVLFRMESGTNRSPGKAYGQAWTNWVNNSVGAIMFFNARSSVLQTLSTVNFINFEDNNIFAAGKAFANQPQYWSDFSFLFNSDFLKNRRAGLATNVNEAELASAVAGATNKAKAALGYLLKIGFTPTQIADSFAIAAGGSTYYRNKIKTYLKSGMSQEQAEARAMLDFQEIAEETQQSARPDRISQQQASPLGRIVLAFANTPMQYNRLIKKAAGDLVNRRGDWRSNVSRILYYGAIQNFIFASLQNALFALAFDDDDEELTDAQQDARVRKEDTKTFRILNSMFDSLARGSGVYGAALATIKNAILEFQEQEQKGFRADYDQVVIELLNVSPPIGSKVRKLASAGYSRKKNKDIMNEMSMLDYDNPAWQAIGNVVEATTNIPMARAIRKADNLREAYNQENSAMQRTFLGLGWSAWDLDVGTEVVKNEGKKNEYVIRLDTKRMNQEKVREKQKENVKKEKKASKQRCTGLTSNMSRCKNMVVKPKTRCHFHD